MLKSLQAHHYEALILKTNFFEELNLLIFFCNISPLFAGNSPYNLPTNISSRNGNFAESKEFEVPLEYIAERDASFAEKIAKKQIEGDSVWKAVVDRNSEIKVVIKHYIRYGMGFSISVSYH